MIAYALKAAPEPQAILRAWMPFKQLVGVTAVHSDEEYAQACVTIDALLGEVGDQENHPLAEVLDYLADQNRQAICPPLPRPCRCVPVSDN